MMEFFGWLETPATAAGPVVNHTRFCRWGCFHQAGFAHSACGARFKSPTRIEVCRFLSESLIKTRPYEKTTANVVTDGWMMKLQTEPVGDPKINRDPFADNPMLGHPSSPSRVRFAAHNTRAPLTGSGRMRRSPGYQRKGQIAQSNMF